MSKLNDLKQQIADYLASCGEFAGAEVLTAYPGRERAYPLPRAVVAVGIDGVELSPVGLGGYLGESGVETLYGGNARITLRFDLYCPIKEEAGSLHTLYEGLCEALMVNRNPFGVTKLTCGEIQIDAAVSAHRVTAKATLAAAILRGKEEERFTEVAVFSPPQAGETSQNKEEWL
jgi:hypothetical protein